MSQRSISGNDLENNPILRGQLSDGNMSQGKFGGQEEEDDDDDVTFESSYGEESEDDDNDRATMLSNKTVKQFSWKPPSQTTYETLTLTNSEFNSKIRGAGFREDGEPRQIKMTGCLLSDIRRRCK